MLKRLRAAVFRGVVIGLVGWMAATSPGIQDLLVQKLGEGMQLVSQRTLSAMAGEAERLDRRIVEIDDRLKGGEELSTVARSSEERQAHASEQHDLNAIRLANLVDLGRVAERADKISQAGHLIARDWPQRRGYFQPNVQTLARQAGQSELDLASVTRNLEQESANRRVLEKEKSELQQQLIETSTVLEEVKAKVELQRGKLEQIANPESAAAEGSQEVTPNGNQRTSDRMGRRVQHIRLRKGNGV